MREAHPRHQAPLPHLPASRKHQTPQQTQRQGLLGPTLAQDTTSRPHPRRPHLPGVRRARHPRRPPTSGHRPPGPRRKPLRSDLLPRAAAPHAPDVPTRLEPTQGVGVASRNPSSLQSHASYPRESFPWPSGSLKKTLASPRIAIRGRRSVARTANSGYRSTSSARTRRLRDGLHSWCRACCAEANREWRARERAAKAEAEAGPLVA